MEGTTFESLGLGEKTLAALRRKGFEEPTPIQALAIPRLLSGDADLVARARTGTGKTAAFGLPLVERLSEASALPRALVLVPTRELAIQVATEIASFKSGAYPRIATVYGGQAMGVQLRQLSRGAEIVVGTPGRVIDLHERGALVLKAVEYFVLDEADEMLDMGFADEIDKVFDAVNPERRVLLFSATMPAGIERVAKRKLRRYETIEDAVTAAPTDLTEQIWLEVREADKLEAFCRIVDMEDDFYGLVFAPTKVDTDRIGKSLEERGYGVETLHGDFAQERRERVMARFRSGKVRILVATDVAARGIDVERLTHVVNWSLPHDPESYVHRIGRTGRAGNEGTAITFVTPQEYRKLVRMREAAGAKMTKGRVPGVEAVLKARMAKALARIGESRETASEEGSPWLALADEILSPEDADPRLALASALQVAFGVELDPSRYGEIEEIRRDDPPGRLVDLAGRTRLYVASGRRDGLDRRSVAELIRSISNLPNRMIDDVQVFDAFSLVTVPFDAAERVIREARGRGGLPFVRVANESKGQGPRQGSYRQGGPKGSYRGRDGDRDGGRDGARKPPRRRERED